MANWLYPLRVSASRNHSTKTGLLFVMFIFFVFLLSSIYLNVYSLRDVQAPNHSIMLRICSRIWKTILLSHSYASTMAIYNKHNVQTKKTGTGRRVIITMMILSKHAGLDDALRRLSYCKGEAIGSLLVGWTH